MNALGVLMILALAWVCVVEPVLAIRRYRRWKRDLRRGLRESARGEVVDLGSFAQYADD